jgi:hypothetical protein
MPDSNYEMFLVSDESRRNDRDLFLPVIRLLFVLLMQDQLSAKSNSLSEALSEIERLNQELSRLEQLSNEKSNESLSLASDLENVKRSFEESQVRIRYFFIYVICL